jgi:coenzyme F420-reducing hydrogenase beta subunit
MQPDALGFLCPEADAAKCVDCGFCDKVCAFNERYPRSTDFVEPRVFAAKQKDAVEVEKSQSGGMFAALSDYVLETHGVVYGAGYTGHFRVVHKRAVTKEERDELRGSKYVQSDMNTIFTQVRDDLVRGKKVLFSGTPCQVAGLHSFLLNANTKTANLYMCDLVCHGVPSPYFWRDYVAYIEAKKKREVVKVNFRDKKFGWRAHKESFTFADGYTYTYTYTFYHHVMLRHSCGKCPFTNTRRPSDITLGDFWGIERLDPNFGADNRGVSLVLVNSSKGFELFNAVKDRLVYIPGTVEQCLQPQLQYPAEIHPMRGNFERDYVARDFAYMIRKYGDMGLPARAKRFCLRVLAAALRRIGLLQAVKKLLGRRSGKK